MSESLKKSLPIVSVPSQAVQVGVLVMCVPVLWSQVVPPQTRWLVWSAASARTLAAHSRAHRHNAILMIRFFHVIS